MSHPTLEQLWRAILRGPLTTRAASAANQWAGRTTLSSGSATVTISTTIVKSDSLIFPAVQAATNQASGVSRSIEVKTISPGNFFTLGWSDGNAIARDTTIMWMIVRTD